MSTLSFCVASSDGRLEPPFDAGEQAIDLNEKLVLDGRFEIQQELGRGGMGCVYLAKDHRLNRLVAIKVVGSRTRESKRSLEESLAREAQFGARFNDPGIASVYDYGVHQGRAFTVFEYIDGDALRDLINRRQRLTVHEALPIIAEIARSLDFAHSHGVVHRDLKPENIRATRHGQFKILDLGLAQEFRRNQDCATFAGTPAYASPEQASSLPSDGRTDQYALAVIAYEMLAGRRPFEHRDPWKLLEAHREHPPAPPSSIVPELKGVVCASILRSLSKSPADRFASCMELANNLGSVDHKDGRRGKAARPVSDERRNLYLCHAGENSPMARNLAQAIKREGCSCWYYEQDALPGISHVTQTSAAIKQCDAVVLMISLESIAAPDVHREVQEAYHLGRRFLPVLLGMTRQEFLQRRPDWQPMIGPAAALELTNSNVASAASRIIKTLQHWEIPPRPHVASPDSRGSIETRPGALSTAVLADGSRKIWASDANQIEIEDLRNVVFRNEMVDDFLERRNKFFLSASKGLGKTLLLTFKRLLLSDHQAGASSGGGVMFVPQGRPYLDFMSDVRSLSKHHEQLVSDLLNTKRLWSLALSVSALSHHGSLITKEDRDELDLFPRRIRQWLSGSAIEPTVVFKELLGQSVKDINRLIDESENFLDHKLRQIHSGTFFFIDKVDQALRQLSQGAWVHVQAGLVEAAWDMMNANSHIKIHASIRQEAFSNYESDIKSNLYGATTMIRYSEDELHQMLDQLARCYESCESFSDFLTLNVVKHPRRPFPEESFRYLRRHTLGRPRDLVIIASKLSAKRRTLNETQFTRLVNETSATGLVSNIFDEMRVFLDCLQDKRERQRFFSLVEHNILTHEDVVRACCLFNGLSEDDYEFYQSHGEGLHHPFCDLYRIGLLGVIAREPDGGRMAQKFKQPHDFITDVSSALPQSPYYLMHPALDDHIHQLRVGPSYNLFQHVTVGDGHTWEDYFGWFCNLERCLFTIDDSGVRESVYRLLSDARILLASDRRPHLRSVLKASVDYKFLWAKCSDESYDELNYWIEELLAYGDE